MPGSLSRFPVSVERLREEGIHVKNRLSGPPTGPPSPPQQVDSGRPTALYLTLPADIVPIHRNLCRLQPKGLL